MTKLTKSVDDFQNESSYGFLKKSIENFLRKSMEVFPNDFFEEYLEDLLSKVPMEVQAQILKRCIKYGLKIFQKHP